MFDLLVAVGVPGWYADGDEPRNGYPGLTESVCKYLRGGNGRPRLYPGTVRSRLVSRALPQVLARIRAEAPQALPEYQPPEEAAASLDPADLASLPPEIREAIAEVQRERERVELLAGADQGAELAPEELAELDRGQARLRGALPSCEARAKESADKAERASSAFAKVAAPPFAGVPLGSPERAQLHAEWRESNDASRIAKHRADEDAATLSAVRDALWPSLSPSQALTLTRAAVARLESL